MIRLAAALALLCGPAWAEPLGLDVLEFRPSDFPGAIGEVYYLNHADMASGSVDRVLSLDTDRGEIEVHVSVYVTFGAERITVTSLTEGWFAYPEFQEVDDGSDFTFYLVEAGA